MSRFKTYVWMKSAITRRLKQSPDTVTGIMQLNVGPADGAKRCGILSWWCGVCCLMPWAPQSHSWWNSMNSIVWTVKYCTLFWDFFHSSHFMRRMVFYVFKCNISQTWIKTLVTMMIEYFVQRWLWKQIHFL